MGMYRISYTEHRLDGEVVVKRATKVHPLIGDAQRVIDHAMSPDKIPPGATVIRSGGGRATMKTTDGLVVVMQVVRAGR